MRVEEATYYLSGEGKEGTKAVLVSRPFFGDAKACYNVQLIADRMFNLMFASLYRRLRMIGAEEECTNVIEVIDLLVRDYLRHNDKDDEVIKEIFSDNRRSMYGKKPHEGGPFKRKHHKTPDSPISRQQTIKFSPDDDPQEAD